MSIALAVPGHRVLLVGCTRPGLDERWVRQLAAREQTTQIAVPRLGPKELVHLLRDALKSERLAEELAGLIAVKSDGNPFFVFEMLRGLKEGQFLAQRPDGTWHTTQVIRDIQVPSSIADLVNARVADLETSERDLLDVAACCGFEFDPSLVAAAAGTGRIPTLKSLAQIERAHRLVRSSGRRFVFDHHQVQEALYGSLPEALREEYHAAIASALEAQHGAEAKEIGGAACVDLAEHLFKGAQGAKALRYLDAALTHLEEGCLNDAAVRLSDYALRVSGLVEGGERATLLWRKAIRLGLLGRRHAEREAIDEALALADAAGDPTLRARVRCALGVHLTNVSREHEAMACLREAQEIASTAGNRTVESIAVVNLGVAFQRLSRVPEAREQFERRLVLSRELGDSDGEAAAVINLALLLVDENRYDEARDRIELGLALSRRCANRRWESVAAGIVGRICDGLGRVTEAKEHYERGLALAREIGDRAGEAVATGNLGGVYSSLGRAAEATEHLQRHLALARETGNRRGEAAATGNLGGIYRFLGRYGEARQHYEQGLALAREIGARQFKVNAQGNLANTLSLLGRLDAGRETGEQAVALARASGFRRSEGYFLVNLGSAADDAGHARDAESAWREAASLLDVIGDAWGAGASRSLLGGFLARAGRVDEARALLHAALATARQTGCPEQEAVAVARLALLAGGDAAAAEEAMARTWERLAVIDQMDVRLGLFRATGNRTHLAEAKRRLDFVVEHAPPEDRETMLTNVRLHREIAAAAREHGV
jgi:tetratricopeptide (TPR) repeat protein